MEVPIIRMISWIDNKLLNRKYAILKIIPHAINCIIVIAIFVK